MGPAPRPLARAPPLCVFSQVRGGSCIPASLPVQVTDGLAQPGWAGSLGRWWAGPEVPSWLASGRAWGLSPSARWPAEAEPAGGGGSRGLGDSPSLSCARFLCQLPALRWERRVGDPVPLGMHLGLPTGMAWGRAGLGRAAASGAPGSSWPAAVFGSKGPALSGFLARASLRGWRVGREATSPSLTGIVPGILRSGASCHRGAWVAASGDHGDCPWSAPRQ